jgi:hypothetical protein
MSVNVRWNGRGWPGKVPGAPSHHLRRQRKLEWKKRPTERYRKKAVWLKTGMAIKKKKKSLPILLAMKRDQHQLRLISWRIALKCHMIYIDKSQLRII